MINRKPRWSQRQYAFGFLLFCVLWSNPSPACGESLELRLTDIDGLNRKLDGRTENLVFVHECSPICSLMGIESLAETNSAHVISSEGIRGSFRLSITLRRRTRPPPQQRQDIPVEVVEHEGGSIDMLDLSRDNVDVFYSQSQSNFEPYGRVLLTGSNPGEKGNLNDNWRFVDEVVAQFIIDTTISAVRRCRKSCRFNSEASFVRRISGNSTLDKPSFKIQLTAFREGAALKSTPQDLLFAGYFAEAAERSLTEDLILPFPFPGRKDDDAARTAVFTDSTGSCTKYRFVSAVGKEIAYVWRLSTVDDSIEHARLDQLDTGRSFDGTTIVVFKDIPKSSVHYTDIWGRNELLPVSFSGSAPYDHFGSFGKVHKGFLTRYNQIAEELRTWLRPGSSVLVTGSFAGGAMAALAFADWLSDSNMDLGMTFGVTFGAAQVGDKLFQRAFREMGKYEPSKASYGFFDQVTAGDEHSGRIDVSTRFPSVIFESFVPYPGVHSIDCLRSVFPVEKLALSSPGHMRTFRTVGRIHFLYAGRHLGPLDPKLRLDRRYSSTVSNDTLRDLADSYFTIDGDRMSHYMERLTSLYADMQQSVYSNDWPNVPNLGVRVTDLGNIKGIRDTTCEATVIPVPTEKLSISVEVSTTKPNPNRALGINLCPSCSRSTPFIESLCRPMLYTANTTHSDYGVVPFALPPTPLTFSSLRPTPSQTCVQILLYALRKPHTCATDTLRPEVVRVAAAPLLELVEVVGCTAKQRCGMEFEGMRLMIAAGVETLVERGGKKGRRIGGILTREEEERNGTREENNGYWGERHQRGKKTDTEEGHLQGRDDGVENRTMSGVNFNEQNDGVDNRSKRGLNSKERNDGKKYPVSAERRASEVLNGASDGGEFNNKGAVGQEDSINKHNSNSMRNEELTRKTTGGESDGIYLGASRESSAVWDANSDFRQLAKGNSLKKGEGGSEFGSERRGYRMLGWGEFTNGEGTLTRGNDSGARESTGGVEISGERGGLRQRGTDDEGMDVTDMGGKGNKLLVKERAMDKVEDGYSDTSRGGVLWRDEGKASVEKERVSSGSGGCETERWCECRAVRVEQCVKGIGYVGSWCEIGACVQMRCGCGGGRRCEKKMGFVYEVLGETGGGGQVKRCVRRVTTVVVEMM